jgi:hypothetical protein
MDTVDDANTAQRTSGQVPGDGPHYDLQLKGDGISVSRRVSQSVALQIISVAMGATDIGSGTAIQAPRTTHQPRSGQVIAIREFLNNSSAKSNPDKITAIAIYLRDHLQRETFSREDVKSLFRKAGEPVPGNYARDFALAVSSGWIAEAHDTSGEYYVTNSGQQALTEGFQAKPTRAKRKRTKGSAKGDQKG